MAEEWRGAIIAFLGSSEADDVYRFIDRNGGCKVTLSGRDILDRAGAQIAGLRKTNSAGDTVGLAMAPGPDFLIMLVACILGGFTVLPLPAPGPGPTRRRLESGLGAVRPQVLVVDAGKRAAGEQLAARHAIPTMYEIQEGGAELVPGPPANPAVLQPTSGTGSDPKIAKISGEAIAANAVFAASNWNIGPGDKVLNWLPHYHDMGLFGTFLVPLVNRFQIVQMAPLTFIQRPIRWLQALSKYQANISGGPAFALELCLETAGPADLAELDLSAIKAIFCGSEPIPPNLLSRFAATLAPSGLDPRTVFACYGMSESTLYIAGKPQDALGTTVAIVRDGLHEVAIADPSDPRILGDKTEGEIVFRGPSLFDGYLGKASRDELFCDRDGKQWFRTGDLGQIDSDQLAITGRKKDMLIVNGVNIAPQEVEQIGASVDDRLSPLGAAAFHVGPLDALRTILLVEARRSGKDVVSGGLENAIANRVAGETGVDLSEVHVLRPGMLPRTTSGKIRRTAARTQFIDGEFVPSAALEK